MYVFIYLSLVNERSNLICMYEGLNALTKDSTVLPLDEYGGAYSARHAATLDHGTSHIRSGRPTASVPVFIVMWIAVTSALSTSMAMRFR